ncbi:MAG: class I SAM-dependent methyltransferase [Planctomycetota bacterium]
MEAKSAPQSNDELRDFYEKKYARADGITGIPADDDFMYGQVVTQIRAYLIPGSKALDLGCNDGALSLYLARHGCDVLGIDLARNAVETAQRSGAHHQIGNARFEVLDFVKDWNGTEEFDCVLCSHVLEHVPQDDVFMRKIHTALKPGGRLLLLTPSTYSSLARLSKFFTGRVAHDEEVGHLRRYNRQSIEQVVRDCGFTIEKIVFLDGAMRDWFILCKLLRRFNCVWSLPVIRRAFNAFDKLTARFFFSATLCIHARRK